MTIRPTDGDEALKRTSSLRSWSLEAASSARDCDQMNEKTGVARSNRVGRRLRQIMGGWVVRARRRSVLEIKGWPMQLTNRRAMDS